LKQIYYSYFGHPENSEWFSMISVAIFEVKIIAEQKQVQLATTFFKFPLPSTLVLSLALPLLRRLYLENLVDCFYGEAGESL